MTEQPHQEPVERIDARAATLLGCHPSNITKLVDKGHLTSIGSAAPASAPSNSPRGVPSEQ